MKRLCVVVLLGLLIGPQVFADTQDTVVFRTRMLPDNEVPPVAAPGNSATATITARVLRDDRGNIRDATVTFEIDYTLATAVIFTGLHIHNAPAGQNGSVVIDTGITATNSVSAALGTGRISRTVNYDSSNTNGIRFVTGLLAMPELYYVNIHTTVNPGGLMRGQLLPTRLIFRPVMSTAFEVPVVPLDAEGAALIDVQVNRDPTTGAITSGTVVFDVDYRFPSAVTLTGLHIHNAAFGANGPVVIDSGLNGTTRSVANVTRGNIFRITDIPSTDNTGLAALNGLFSDPTQYYVNLHTTANPGGVIRGQLARNVYVFFNHMTQAEEVPPTGVSGTANSMTYVGVNRDSSGNIASGVVSFNVNYNIGEPVTFSGLHIHSARFGVNGPVLINTGISGAAPVVSAQGFGSVNREVVIDGSNADALGALRGLLENPENYYVNIHSTTPPFPGGIVRAQLARETYHFKANMSPANEVPPVTGVDTAATGWITAKIARDGGGTITGGTVTFDINFTNTGAITFTGLHIHHPAPAGANAGVTINTGLSATAPFESTTGSGNVTRVVDVPASNTNAIATLTALVTAPETAYVNLHSTTFPGGVVRSQMFPVVNTVPQVAGGGEWSTAITIRNPSSSTSVQGIVDFFQTNGTPFPEAVTDPNVKFLIPPSGSVTVSTFSRTGFTVGNARIFSNGNVTVESRYFFTAFTTAAAGATTVTSRSVSLPVFVAGTSQNTGVSLIANSAGTLTLSLRDSGGNAIAGGSRTIDVTAGQNLSQFVTQLLPSVTATTYSGTLTITTSSGTISVLALQFNGTLAPVTVTALP
jgi:hypothetical protein